MALSFWKMLVAHLQDGQRVFLALVAAHERHSPGTTGAKLLVPEQGDLAGSIGGGIMEHTVVQRARVILAGDGAFRPEIQTLDHHAKGDGVPSGLVCAGRQINLYYLCRPEKDLAPVEEAVALMEEDRPGVLVITPSGMAVEERRLEPERPPVTLARQGGAWRYEEQVLNRKRLAILGGGHCSLALSRIMRWLGYDVRVFDTRPDVPSFERNTHARTIRIEEYAEAGAHIPFPELTDVVLMTNDFNADVQGLQGVLPLPFPYVGLMGSDAKIGRVFSALRKAGISREALARVTAPVGLPIESDSPEEIAVSVAAQLIQRRNTTA